VNPTPPTIDAGPTEKPKLTVYASPRERFVSDAKNVRAHQDLVDRPEFDRGADVAMIEVVRNLANKITDSNSAMAAGYELRGAVAFLMQLKTLAEGKRPTPKSGNPDALISTEPQRRA
jgi:hypothetical protein